MKDLTRDTVQIMADEFKIGYPLTYDAIYDRGRADAFNQKRTVIGCIGCAFLNYEEWEMPCTKCKRIAKDYWRPKEGNNE